MRREQQGWPAVEEVVYWGRGSGTEEGAAGWREGRRGEGLERFQFSAMGSKSGGAGGKAALREDEMATDVGVILLGEGLGAGCGLRGAAGGVEVVDAHMGGGSEEDAEVAEGVGVLRKRGQDAAG